MTLRAFVGQLIAILAMAVAMPASADTHDEVIKLQNDLIDKQFNLPQINLNLPGSQFLP